MSTVLIKLIFCVWSSLFDAVDECLKLWFNKKHICKLGFCQFFLENWTSVHCCLPLDFSVLEYCTRAGPPHLATFLPPLVVPTRQPARSDPSATLELLYEPNVYTKYHRRCDPSAETMQEHGWQGLYWRVGAEMAQAMWRTHGKWTRRTASVYPCVSSSPMPAE